MITLPNGPLVSAAWLAEHHRDVRVVDVRGLVRPPGENPRYVAKRGDYDQGHITGAFFVDWTRDIVDLHDKVPVQIARPEHFASTMSSIGVGDDTAVVVYDDYKNTFASRLAWALRYYGHDAVRVLDGGWRAWLAQGGPTSAHPPRPISAQFHVRVRPELRRTAEQVMRDISAPEGSARLIDARPAAQFMGEVSAAARKGHIPGAKSVPYESIVREDGTFKSPEELSQLFAAAGIDPTDARPIVAYCNGGVTACAVRTALAIVGRDDVAIYDGSWNEWGNDPSRPIE